MSEVQKFPFVVILDNVRSALNVGAIFRTCDGAGVSKLYLCGITPYPPHNRIPKTALGAIDYVEWERVEDCVKLVTTLKQNNYTIFAVEQTDSAKVFNEVEYPEHTALVFGHEISGVSEEVLKLANYHVELPMFGHKESLNIATCAGIMSYHVAMSLNKRA